MSKKKLIITILLIAVVIAGISIYYLQGHKNYYAQIDNTKVSEIEAQNGLYHRYELDTYDENGNKKTISFETRRELTNGAFICLDYAPIRGVISLSEVSYDELPVSVQTQYTAP